jgi:branched-chain amino acid aminotransferase
VLWLYGEDHEVTEVGAMNIFFALRKPNSSTVELVTPSLTRGDILPGVTRASILELARSWSGSGEGVEVFERFVTMKEIQQAGEEGRLLEIFGAGTAAVVSPVGCILYNGQEIGPSCSKEAGKLTMKFYQTLLDIQYGNSHSPHPWSVVVK